MKTYRLRFLGSTAWLIIIAVVTLPMASFPAFLYLLCNFQLEVTGA